MSLIAVIRIRGSVKVNKKILDTFNMLNLTRVNHAVVLKDSPVV